MSYRDDMNLLSFTPPDSPHAWHCKNGRVASKTLWLSTMLSTLCVCLLLYLLTALSKPRRSAQAAIFCVVPWCVQGAAWLVYLITNGFTRQCPFVQVLYHCCVYVMYIELNVRLAEIVRLNVRIISNAFISSQKTIIR